MKGTKIRQYRKDNGNLVHVYAVSGTKQEIALFEECQGDNLVVDNGQPLWFTVNYAGESTDLIATSKGNIIADTSKMDAAMSLADQYAGTATGDAIAARLADELVGSLFASKPSAQPAPQKVAEESGEDFGDL